MDCEDLPESGWLARFDGRCYFYPGRDCPGWHAGGICSRIRKRIPDDAEE